MTRNRMRANHSQGGLRIAYLTTVYPSVSHTFIRRELLEMERRGHTVLRLSIRRSDVQLVDPLDREEQKKTITCLSQSAARHVTAIICAFLTDSGRFCRALVLAIRMGRRSERGVLRHLAYFMEACTFLSILRRNPVDHVHAHFGTNPATVARLMRQCGGPPYSFTVHGPAEFDAPASLDLSGKIHNAQFVVAISDYCAAQLYRWSRPADWSSIRVVRCTVGDDFFDAAGDGDPAGTTFVCVGRLSAQKGHLILLDAFAQILRNHSDARLVLVGDGELRAVLEEKIVALGLGANVAITGFVCEAEVRRHIYRARALVMPSFAEGLPMVIMEAYALRRPVIATWVAGIPELVRPGQSGWLVPAANIANLAEAMAECLETDGPQLAFLAETGRKMTRRMHRTVTEGARLDGLLRRSQSFAPLVSYE